jgi:hypothetical protein
MPHLTKSNAQLARAATTFGIGVAGLFLVRLIVQGLPMFREAGWIVKDKLTIVAAALIVVDAILISVLIGFAVQLRAYLVRRIAEIPGLGTMAANLVLLLCAGIAYTDFKPLTRAWPSIKDLYLWIFFVLALVLIAHLIVLLYQNKDRIAALILHQPIPIEEPSEADAKAALATR